MARLLSILLAVLTLTGCGGGSSPPDSVTITTVTGTVVVSSPASTGNVAVYDFSSGSKGALLASGAIAADGSGNYALSYTAAHPPSTILIEATNECYLEYSYMWEGAYFGGIPVASATLAPQFGFAPVCADSLMPALNAVAVVAPGSTAAVAVTPYTHAELGLVQYEIRQGATVATAITGASASFTQLLGFDPATTLPAMPQHVETPSKATSYGGLIAAIPGWLYNVGYFAPSNTSLALLGTPGLTTLNFAEDMRRDLDEDGILNGVGRDTAGNTVALSIVGVPLSTDVYRHGLAKYAVGQLRGYFESVAGYTVSDTQRVVGFLPALEAYNNATVLFDGTAVTPLDENYPLIDLASPASGATLSGDPSINGYVSDIVGIAQPASIPTNCVLLVDGVYYDSFSDPYHPNHYVNTTVFANGPHTLTIQVTNSLGTTASKSVAVTFSN